MASIVEEFQILLNNYLDKKILEDDIRCWIGYHLDEPPDEILPLFYDVTLALWDMEYARKTGHATEDDFRAAVAELLAEQQTPVPGGDA